MGDVHHAVRLRVLATDPGLTVKRTGSDTFEVRGAVTPTRAALRPWLELKVDGHVARVELVASMSHEELVGLLERALPGEYELLAWALCDGFGALVSTTSRPDTPPESSPSTA